MRLIYVKRLRMVDFGEGEIPEYAILSHRWGNEELSYKDMLNSKEDASIRQRKGYRKITDACVMAQRHHLAYLWVDTCCIDKTSSAELTEAINSMYRWYKDSKLCLVYLSDIDNNKEWSYYTGPSDRSHFTSSEWFLRSWTLQELIAPRELIFYDARWNEIARKDSPRVLEVISKSTGISPEALWHPDPLDRFSIAERMSWASRRKATRTEDIAYSLLGIFDVNMPMLYGEGRKAFTRLQEEIIRRDADRTILAWLHPSSPHTLLACSPADFAHHSKGSAPVRPIRTGPFMLNNLGLEIDLQLEPADLDTYVAHLNEDDDSIYTKILLKLKPFSEHVLNEGVVMQSLREGPSRRFQKKVTILARSEYTHQERALLGPNAEGFHQRGFEVFVPHQSCGTLLPVISDESENIWTAGQWTTAQLDDCKTQVFVISNEITFGIAMFTFSTGDVHLLVQLAFDSAWNPMCCIQKLDTPVDLKTPEQVKTWVTEYGTEQNTWWNMACDWSLGPTSQYEETSMNISLATNQECWLVKAVNRRDFSATLPTRLAGDEEERILTFVLRPEARHNIVGDDHHVTIPRWTFGIHMQHKSFSLAEVDVKTRAMRKRGMYDNTPSRSGLSTLSPRHSSAETAYVAMRPRA